MFSVEMAQPNQPVFHESLAQFASRWRKELLNSDTGPLIVAGEIVGLSQQWTYYQAEANGMSFNAWLFETGIKGARGGNGRNLRYWQVRHLAVEQLGEAIRRFMHHDAAVWLYQQGLDEVLRQKVKRQIKLETDSRNNGRPLSPAQVVRLVEKIIGKKSPKKPCPAPCERCAALEAQLKELGIEPVQ